jgi:hypothetical protein
MAKQMIMSVGFQVPGNVVRCVPFKSSQSLLDADVVLFQPDIHQYSASFADPEYAGRKLISQSDSARLVDDISHWRSELRTAAECGKTVVVLMARLEQVYVYTGEKNLSGTGRSQKATLLVKSTSNYDAIPLNLGHVVPKSGHEIRVTSSLDWLKAYWKAFAQFSEYQVYLDDMTGRAILTTWTGGKAVGAVYRLGKGTVILLPALDYDPTAFYDDNDDLGWSKAGVAFGNRLMNILVEIDKAVRLDVQGSPPPGWASEEQFRLPREVVIGEQVGRLSRQIVALEGERRDLEVEAEREGALRSLLYETGGPLENIIIEVLRDLGFSAEGYRDSESEFDVVFTSPEGRFLGEAEGRDDKPIAIDKLSQLVRNLDEEFGKREELAEQEYAKGVLFGNAYRLRALSDRPEDYFTPKCMTSAKRHCIALVRTPDLFWVAKYLREHKDSDFAAKSRQAIFTADGQVVVFPKAPRRGRTKRGKEGPKSPQYRCSAYASGYLYHV